MAETACPICARPTLPSLRPFCSTRCADIDLGRWFNETYAVPAPPPDAEEADDLPG